MEQIDKKVQDLFEVVQRKKEEIAKAEKPNWITNLSFAYDKNSSARTNLQVCSDVRELVNILAFLIERKENFEKAIKLVNLKLKFDWMGYSFEDWENDIKTRITISEINKEKRELSELELALNNLVSPEMKRQMEIDRIEKLLSK